jgi:serine/threonine protein phosphatase PrpC
VQHPPGKALPPGKAPPGKAPPPGAKNAKQPVVIAKKPVAKQGAPGQRPPSLELDDMPELLTAADFAADEPTLTRAKAPQLPNYDDIQDAHEPRTLPKAQAPSVPPSASPTTTPSRGAAPPPSAPSSSRHMKPSGDSFAGFGVLALPDLDSDQGLDEAPESAEEEAEPAPDTQANPALAGEVSSLVVAGLTDVGSVRTNNEDAFAVIDVSQAGVLEVAQEGSVAVGPRGILLLVSDGMGGANAGEVASAIVVETVTKRLAESSVAAHAAALAESITASNSSVIEAAKEPGREGMGATVVAALIVGAEAITAEVGDSRAYLVRNGEATLVTKDQTYVQLLLDQGILTPETVANSRAKNVVLQAIGKADEVTVAQRRIALRQGDVLLLCSDGLTAYVNEPEIAATLQGPLDEGCKKLVAMANERGGKDNITVVAARADGSLAPPSAGEPVASTIMTIREATLGPGGG